MIAVIDGKSVAYRIYYANPMGVDHLASNFLAAVRKFAPVSGKVAVAWEAGKTWRRELAPSYKAQREAPPLPLRLAIAPAIEAVREANIPVYEFPDYEADDIIATIVDRIVESGEAAQIVTLDKDMLQLVSDSRQVTVYCPYPAPGKTYTDESVERAWGVPPRLIPDLLGLAGDSSDNIPGVDGIGKVKAAKMVQAHGTIEEIIACVSTSPDVLRVKMAKETALKSKQLATLVRGLPLPDGPLWGSV